MKFTLGSNNCFYVLAIIYKFKVQKPTKISWYSSNKLIYLYNSNCVDFTNSKQQSKGPQYIN